MPQAQFHRTCTQRVNHIHIRHRRVFQRQVMAGRSLITDRGGHYHHIAHVYIGLHRAGGAHPHQRIRAHIDQFLHRNCCGRAADARGDYRHLFAKQGTAPGDILAVLRHKMRIVKVFRDLFAARRVTRQEHVAPDIAFFYMKMKRQTFFIAHILPLVSEMELNYSASFIC